MADLTRTETGQRPEDKQHKSFCRDVSSYLIKAYRRLFRPALSTYVYLGHYNDGVPFRTCTAGKNVLRILFCLLNSGR
jgi:hypothetical protein